MPPSFKTIARGEDKEKDTQTDIADTRLNQARGQLSEGKKEEEEKTIHF